MADEKELKPRTSSLTPTGRYMNWINPTFTPVSGTAVIYDGLTNCSIDEGGSTQSFAGDNSRGPQLVVNDYNDPTITLTFANAAKAMAWRTGTVGSFSITQLDAQNGASPGGGGLVYTIANAVVVKPQATGAYRKFADNTVMIKGYDPSGSGQILTISSL